ncbi:hypothetical protein L6164_001348 [Bauhinia variegata]|uniref:Uncharacterized protein n=1 Tax=Bauhinia variegata TaxID=167791 RepID=A0ACB9QAM4_BAUVA|nr:hypothetical protein L6164_001348 [Bauhinia variegata]
MEAVSHLQVPCVQELAKEPLIRVPERYVRTDLEPSIVSDANFLPQVPVIDLSKLLSEDEDLHEHELQKLDYACKEWGFFQLVNHGVSISLVESVKKGVQEFFNLPLEEKKKFGQKEGELEGFGQLFVMSEEQKLDWADMFFMVTLPPEMRKPHLFPNIHQPFRDNLEVYSLELKKLTLKILSQMAKALKMDDKDMKELFEEGAQSARMNYYPPCPQPELVIGLNPHSDGGGLTILLQVNEMEGLQIRKDGIWIPIKPLPNAFIINIGDILEIVTNGIYRSIEHRATVNSEKERISVATFYNPSFEKIIGPAPSLIGPERPAKFRSIGVAEHFKGYVSRELRGKSYVDVMKNPDCFGIGYHFGSWVLFGSEFWVILVVPAHRMFRNFHGHQHHHQCGHGHHHHHEKEKLVSGSKLPEELAEEQDMKLYGFVLYHDRGHDYHLGHAQFGASELSGLALWLNELGSSFLYKVNLPRKLLIHRLYLGLELYHSHDAGLGHGHSHSLADLSTGISILAGIVLFLLVEKVVRYVEDNSGGYNTWTHGHHCHHHNSNKKLKDDNDSHAGPQSESLKADESTQNKPSLRKVGDFGILIRSGFSIQKTLFFNFLSALVALAGTTLAFLWGQDPGQSSLIEWYIAIGKRENVIAKINLNLNQEKCCQWLMVIRGVKGKKGHGRWRDGYHLNACWIV